MRLSETWDSRKPSALLFASVNAVTPTCTFGYSFFSVPLQFQHSSRRSFRCSRSSVYWPPDCFSIHRPEHRRRQPAAFYRKKNPCRQKPVSLLPSFHLHCWWSGQLPDLPSQWTKAPSVWSKPSVFKRLSALNTKFPELYNNQNTISNPGDADRARCINRRHNSMGAESIELKHLTKSLPLEKKRESFLVVPHISTWLWLF